MGYDKEDKRLGITKLPSSSFHASTWNLWYLFYFVLIEILGMTI